MRGGQRTLLTPAESSKEKFRIMYVGFLLFSPLSLLLPSPFLPCFFFFSSPPPFFCAEAIYLNSRDAENENQPGCFFSTLPPLPSSPPPPKKLLPTHAKCLPFIPLSLSLSLSFLYVSPGERRRTEGGFCKEETLLPQTTSACGWVYLQHQPPPHPNFDLSLSLSLFPFVVAMIRRKLNAAPVAVCPRRACYLFFSFAVFLSPTLPDANDTIAQESDNPR